MNPKTILIDSIITIQNAITEIEYREDLTIKQYADLLESIAVLAVVAANNLRSLESPLTQYERRLAGDFQTC